MKRWTRFHLTAFIALLVGCAGAAPGAAADVPAGDSPGLTLSGSLYDGRGTTLAEGVYELDIRAEGAVRSIEVRVDGDWDESWEQECAAASCPMERTYTFDMFDWPGIEWTITVVATDVRGNEATSEEIRVTPPGDPGDPGYEVPDYAEDELDDPDPDDGPWCGMTPTPGHTELAETGAPEPSTEPVAFTCVLVTPGAVPDEGVESEEPTEDGDWAAEEPADDEELVDDEEPASGDEALDEAEADDATDDGEDAEPAAAAESTPAPDEPYGRDDVAAPVASMR